MSRRARSRSTARRSLLAVAALLLVTGLLSSGPAGAHTFTKSDGDDSPGRLDIRTASVGHTNNNVVHTVRTFEGWTPKSLGKDSFFVVEIDKNFDNDFEQCAFIFFAGGRLRGSLTNCRRTFIRQLPVSKPSKAVARITIPTANTGGAYRWVVFSFWTGLPARCSDLCFDAAPNRPPPILHDLTPPVVTMPSTDPIRVWEQTGGTDASFEFPFTLSDPGGSGSSGVATWKVQRRLNGSSSWTDTGVSGTGTGTKTPTIQGTAGTRDDYRVVATDKHGNTRIGPSRAVFVPIDDASVDQSAFTGEPTTVMNTDAFGGSYQTLDVGEVFTWEVAGFDECLFELIGPGTGDWVVEVHVNGGIPFTTLHATDFAEEQRQLLFDMVGCVDPATITFTVTSGAGFGIDAFVPPA
jgi:hypothetical protein